MKQITIAETVITEQHKRDFFRLTRSTPEELAKWLKWAIKGKYSFPCTFKRYKGRYTFFSGGEKMHKLRQDNKETKVFLGFFMWDVHDEILRNEKSFNRLIRFILGGSNGKK